MRSASDRGSKPGKRAEYHLYDFEQEAGRYRITLRRRPGDEAPVRLDSA